MRHFAHLDTATTDHLFAHPPGDVDRFGDRELVATALGATLYAPATRPDLARDVRRAATRGVLSMVLCLEDAIGDHDVAAAEANLARHLITLHRQELSGGTGPLPMLFVRVRRAAQVDHLAEVLGEAIGLLSGFVAPKYRVPAGRAYLEAVARAQTRAGHPLWLMPVLETPELMHLETRADELLALREQLRAHRDQVLAVRIGCTDLSSCFALRRPRDLTVYDLQPVASLIGDVVNCFGRPADAFVITGPVWEYFDATERLLKPQLRQTPFVTRHDEKLREHLISHDLDGLIREVLLDRANGLVGKTVIHPSHVGPVHALHTVTDEEHTDARDIVARAGQGGGVQASGYRNKMNEAGPHLAWARRILRRAHAFGVTRPGIGLADLLHHTTDPGPADVDLTGPAATLTPTEGAR